MFGDDDMELDNLVTKILDFYSLEEVIESLDISEENLIKYLIMYKIISKKDLKELIDDA